MSTPSSSRLSEEIEQLVVNVPWLHWAVEIDDYDAERPIAELSPDIAELRPRAGRENWTNAARTPLWGRVLALCTFVVPLMLIPKATVAEGSTSS